MKRIFTFMAVLLSLSFCSMDTSAQEYEVGTGVLNLGVGLGGWSYALGGFSPAISASYEVGFKETGDIGVLGIGALVGFRTTSWTDTRYTDITIAPRVTWHLTIIPVENLDVYAAAQVVTRLQRYKFTGILDDSGSSFYVYPSLIAAARYYFSDSFGVFAELGYGNSYLTAGASFRFGGGGGK